MPSTEFTAALPFVLRWEGGFVNHPDDPGGATNKGVTQKVYDSWRTAQQLPIRHVRGIEHAEVVAIYEQQYWIPSRCDVLRSKLDVVQFDTAVNMGVSRAIRLLQGVLLCHVDGDFGSRTEQAAARCDIASTMAAYCDARETYYRRLAEKNPRLQVFLKGWLNRLNALRWHAGVPGAAAVRSVDRGDIGYIARIPDIGIDPMYDVDDR